MQKPIYEIDGSRFSTLQGFFDEISRVLIPGADWRETSTTRGVQRAPPFLIGSLKSLPCTQRAVLRKRTA